MVIDCIGLLVIRLTEQRWGGLEGIYSPESRVTKNLFLRLKRRNFAGRF